MATYRIESWSDYVDKAEELLKLIQIKREERRIPVRVSDALFRGQSVPSWGLDTTLDRYSKDVQTIRGYHRLMAKVRSPFESITNREWKVPNWESNFDDDIGPPAGYEFMAYLRHIGFPSPLLDWSRSPYVAAFFAYEPTPVKNQKFVTIYSFIEELGEGKEGCFENPTVIGCGPYIRTHPRHHLQQSEYTICKQIIDGKYSYSNHNDALDTGEYELSKPIPNLINRSDPQDILIRFKLPISERNDVLRRLDLMNINRYSLFNDESGLAHSLAYRELG